MKVDHLNACDASFGGEVEVTVCHCQHVCADVFRRDEVCHIACCSAGEDHCAAHSCRGCEACQAVCGGAARHSCAGAAVGQRCKHASHLFCRHSGRCSECQAAQGDGLTAHHVGKCHGSAVSRRRCACGAVARDGDQTAVAVNGTHIDVHRAAQGQIGHVGGGGAAGEDHHAIASRGGCESRERTRQGTRARDSSACRKCSGHVCSLCTRAGCSKG